MKVEEDIGTIEEKSEAVKKDGKENYWRYKITISDGHTYTFSQWNFEDGKEIHVGDKVKLFWTEKEGTGAHGPVTYRNINSLATLKNIEKYEKDPELAKKSDEELAKEAPKGPFFKKVEEILDAGTTMTSNNITVDTCPPPSSISEREERKQLLIVRQSSINYATQLVTIFTTWDFQHAKDTKSEQKGTLNDYVKEIKKVAKEYEKQIMEGK